MTTLGWPIPPKPATFTPDGAPDGVEVKFVTFWQQRPMLRDPLRSAFVHTNGASGEGSIDSAWNWAHAKPGSNTCPHYQIDRTHDGVTRARKMLPSNRRAIANATVDAYQDGHGDVAWWSLAIETADLGWGAGKPAGACGFDDQQGELIATVIAYEAVVSPALRLELLAEWYGAGVASHTDPFTYPYTTLYKGKACPGEQKKREVREWIIPRAVEIHAAWTGAPVVVEPPIVTPPVVPVSGTYPPGSRDVMYPIDYGIAGTDSWWTEMAVTPKGLQWSGGPSPESQKIRQIFVAVPMPRAPRLQNDADVVNLMQTIGTFGDCPSTFLGNVGLRDAWAANLNKGR